MREPLVAPLAAIATGILASRYLSFEPAEILTFLAAFFILSLLSLWRRMRAAAMVCCLAAFWLAGMLAAWAHRPAPAPELDAGGSRETVLIEGCVVEPPVLFE
ncbi:MAG: hypothetical protein ACRD8O_10180, partial [Bryobacteraceae bacterium]